MGNRCSSPVRFVNEQIPNAVNNFIPQKISPEELHAVVVYVDYGFEPAKSQGWCPAGFCVNGATGLDTKENAEMFMDLLSDCGCPDKNMKLLSNLDATKENVIAAIEEIGANCDENDVFVFFYSGHGAGMQDQDGVEDDGQDEAMCLPDSAGNCNQNTWLRDDDFAEAAAAVEAGHKALIFDCCHSGTMCDFDRECWQKEDGTGQNAVSMVGCRDSQESAGMAKQMRGGAFTRTLTTVIRNQGVSGRLATEDGKETNAADIYNQVLTESDNWIPQGHQQDIQLSCPTGVSPDEVEWPLYLCDVSKRTAKKSKGIVGTTKGIIAAVV